jgi:hypothetical protein
MKPATLLLLNAPDFLEFGIDNQYWKVGSKFKVSPLRRESNQYHQEHTTFTTRCAMKTTNKEKETLYSSSQGKSTSENGAKNDRRSFACSKRRRKHTLSASIVMNSIPI